MELSNFRVLGFCSALFWLAMANGCSSSSQPTISRSQSLPAYSSIEFAGATEIRWQQSEAPTATMRGAKQDVDEAELYVENHVLRLRYKRTRPSRSSLILELRGTRLNSIDLSGATKMEARNLIFSPLSIRLSGSSEANLVGSVDEMTLHISGASEVKAGELQTKRILLNLNGASSATVFASDRIIGEVHGASTLRHRGGAEVQVSESGASSVRGGD